MNIFDNLFGNATKLHQRKRKFVVKDIDRDGLFEKTEETSLDEFDGPKTEELCVVYEADCGHMVGFYGPHELIARCSKCGNHLCHRCGNLRCKRCLDIVCHSCAKVVAENAVYCARCRAIHYLKGGTLFSLRGLHEILSKEIRDV